MSAQFVYHIKPSNLSGNILFPLNQMKDSLPSVYEAAVLKYRGREYLLEEKIPPFDCRWNDVLFFCPLDLNVIFDFLATLNYYPRPSCEYFKIPVENLKHVPVGQYDYPGEDLSEHAAESYRLISWDSIPKVTELPVAQREYFEKQLKGGNRPLLFIYIPHVLVRGTIDITGVPVLSWKKDR